MPCDTPSLATALGAGNGFFESGEAADGNQVCVLPHRLAEIADGLLHRATGVTAGPRLKSKSAILDAQPWPGFAPH